MGAVRGPERARTPTAARVSPRRLSGDGGSAATWSGQGQSAGAQQAARQQRLRPPPRSQSSDQPTQPQLSVQIDRQRASDLGVELDDPLGKNDGSAGTVRYFTCAENHGTFAKPTNVQCGDFPNELDDSDDDEM